MFNDTSSVKPGSRKKKLTLTLETGESYKMGTLARNGINMWFRIMKGILHISLVFLKISGGAEVS